MRTQRTTSSGIQANKEQSGVDELIPPCEEVFACVYVCVRITDFPLLRDRERET